MPEAGAPVIMTRRGVEGEEEEGEGTEVAPPRAVYQATRVAALSAAREPARAVKVGVGEGWKVKDVAEERVARARVTRRREESMAARGEVRGGDVGENAWGNRTHRG